MIMRELKTLMVMTIKMNRYNVEYVYLIFSLNLCLEMEVNT